MKEMTMKERNTKKERERQRERKRNRKRAYCKSLNALLSMYRTKRKKCTTESKKWKKEREQDKKDILYEPEYPVVPVRHTAVQQTSSSQPSWTLPFPFRNYQAIPYSSSLLLFPSQLHRGNLQNDSFSLFQFKMLKS